ncbi:heat-inducible transcriptional repressor HrcA [Leptothermofonsia sichuanensis E412]|jgi:heat-inducible transcriptional repressor|uniref:heat-inducible transcriptional repressor HrcA n=1 Tax=Leptothermofonsia sichuanensis TaxID=2917832 RepID=UPI001CA5FB22|nr:heat-inducible transcriptional repressor HrcA [Leptothermofonsia sichuanensis]QZZ22510.1 heat-inducible transcriptional repressor HrcA [Leptothermofonsia sichuanensis E412]
MSLQINLTNRQQQVLWATVRHYIATAEPVGSEALVKEYNLSVSSATIRNAMAVLEKTGLLYQPHISAGRVPSDSGYRIYVDQLITPSNQVTSQVEQLLSDRLNREDWSLEALLRGAAQILATVSGYITLITLPLNNTTYLRHVQLVQVDAQRVMLIFVTDSYETQSALMDLPSPLEGPEPDSELLERELQILSNFLNEQLRGKAIAELATLDWGELDREFKCYADFLRAVLAEVTRRSQTSAPTQIMVSGLAEVLRQPEFSELHQIQTIVHLLEEEQDQLLPLMFEQSDAPQSGKRLTIRIGAENPLEPIQTCTLISSTYHRGTIPVGSVGMLGPTRMVYENAIALVEAAADYLSETLSHKPGIP